MFEVFGVPPVLLAGRASKFASFDVIVFSIGISGRVKRRKVCQYQKRKPSEAVRFRNKRLTNLILNRLFCKAEPLELELEPPELEPSEEPS